MSQQGTIADESSSVKMLRAMVGIGVLCALLIVLTYEGTKPRITQLKALALEKAIFGVLPGTKSLRSFEIINDELQIAKGNTGGDVLYAGYDGNGTLIGVAIKAQGQGYADIISVLYGYDVTNKKIIGFYVLESKETPGLGDKIEKDESFLANFEGLAVTLNESGEIDSVITTVKSGTKSSDWEIDGITGATISSRAIGDILGKSTSYWAPIIEKQKEKLNGPGNTQ